MHPLATEHLRLYLPSAEAADAAAPDAAASTSKPDDPVRALVLTLAQPADPDGLLRVWHRVQDELDLPAPAIAVNGEDGFQLWFSVAEPVNQGDAAAFLMGLRQRYLAQSPSKRIAAFPVLPMLSAQPPVPAQPLPLPPSQQATTGCWSAFVAPDLVRIFADEPWLDREPSAQAQADLLSRMRSMPLAAFERALATLRVPQAPHALTQAHPANAGAPEQLAPPTQSDAPRQFLHAVMNDPTMNYPNLCLRKGWGFTGGEVPPILARFPAIYF